MPDPLLNVVIIVFVLIVCTLVIIIKLREIHAAMNSRLDELLNTTRNLAHMEGFKAGQDQKKG